jgi:hypothetical protein
MITRMGTLITCLCLVTSPGWAWDFTAKPICTLSWENEDSSVVVSLPVFTNWPMAVSADWKALTRLWQTSPPIWRALLA